MENALMVTTGRDGPGPLSARWRTMMASVRRTCSSSATDRIQVHGRPVNPDDSSDSAVTGSTPYRQRAASGYAST
jgi:hypothetical protein